MSRGKSFSVHGSMVLTSDICRAIYPYIDDLYRKNIFSYSGSDLCEALYFQAVYNLCKDREEIDEYFENLKREREAAQEKEEQTTE